MVSFATDPGTDVFLRGLDAGERARKARNAVAVDAAVRRGLASTMGAAQPDAAGAPALAPAPAADGVAPAAAPPPQPALAPAPQAPPQGGPVASPSPAPAPRPALAPAAAMPGAQPVGDRYEPVLRELSQVEGGGTAALGVMQQQDRSAAVDARRRDQLARMSMYALSKGDVATGQYFASQAGIPLPNIQPGRGGRGGRAGAGPGGAAGADVAQAKAIGQAALDAKRIYGHNPKQGEVYFRTFIETGGDRVKAVQAASQMPDPTWRQEWVLNEQTGQSELHAFRRDNSSIRLTDDDGKPFVRAPQQRVVPTQGGYATVNPQEGTARPVTQPDGTQLPAPQRGGAAGAGPGAAPRLLNVEAKRDLLIQGGLNPQAAALEAVRGTLSPAARAQVYTRIQSAVGADLMIPPEKKAAEIERRFRDFEAQFGGGAPAAGTPAPSLPRAPVEAAPPAAPLAPAPSAPPAAAPTTPPASAAVTDPSQLMPQDGVRHPQNPAWRWSGRYQQWLMPVPNQPGKWTRAQ